MLTIIWVIRPQNGTGGVVPQPDYPQGRLATRAEIERALAYVSNSVPPMQAAARANPKLARAAAYLTQRQLDLADVLTRP